MPSAMGRLAMPLDDRCRFYGIVASVVLHGAVATAIVCQLAVHAGAPAPAETRVMVVNLRLVQQDRPSDADQTSRPVDQAAALPQAAPAKLSRPSAPAPSLTPVSLPRPVQSARVPSASSAQASLRETEGASRTDYEAALREHMRPFFAYPEAARPARLHGAVEVRFSVGRDGRLLGVSVQDSSGSAILDAAAVDLIRRAQPLPVLPRDLPDPLDVSLPLEYIPPPMTVGARLGSSGPY